MPHNLVTLSTKAKQQGQTKVVTAGAYVLYKHILIYCVWALFIMSHLVLEVFCFSRDSDCRISVSFHNFISFYTLYSSIFKNICLTLLNSSAHLYSLLCGRKKLIFLLLEFLHELLSTRFLLLVYAWYCWSLHLYSAKCPSLIYLRPNSGHMLRCSPCGYLCGISKLKCHIGITLSNVSLSARSSICLSCFAYAGTTWVPLNTHGYIILLWHQLCQVPYIM